MSLVALLEEETVGRSALSLVNDFGHFNVLYLYLTGMNLWAFNYEICQFDHE